MQLGMSALGQKRTLLPHEHCAPNA